MSIFPKEQTNHLSSLLDIWHLQKDELEWVLATIIETDGSSYRKPGAIMFINSLGQYFGLLSGGCLEADIMRQARKCLANGKNQVIQYDMRDEDDLAWKLGIGCGGLVRILLQPLSRENNYLELQTLKDSLQNNKVCYYLQTVNDGEPENRCLSEKDRAWSINKLNQNEDATLFISQQNPVIRLGIFGGGIDAKPLVTMAKTLGWHVTVYDERLGYAKENFFSDADSIIREKYDDLAGDVFNCASLDEATQDSSPQDSSPQDSSPQDNGSQKNSSQERATKEKVAQGHPSLQTLSAIILMNHNIVLDAKSLQLAQLSSASYVGMLGPGHRTDRVFNELTIPKSDIVKPLYNPVGLGLGGELPESIALCMLAEIHACLYKSSGQSLSNWAGL